MRHLYQSKAYKLNVYVSFAKEPYKRDYILPKRPISGTTWLIYECDVPLSCVRGWYMPRCAMEWNCCVLVIYIRTRTHTETHSLLLVHIYIHIHIHKHTHIHNHIHTLSCVFFVYLCTYKCCTSAAQVLTSRFSLMWCTKTNYIDVFLWENEYIFFFIAWKVCFCLMYVMIWLISMWYDSFPNVTLWCVFYGYGEASFSRID